MKHAWCVLLAFVLTSSVQGAVQPGGHGCLLVSLQVDNQQTNPKKADATDGDLVVQSTGNLLLQETDLSLANRGSALPIVRTYRSGTAVDSALGPGWDMNWLERFVVRYTPPAEPGTCLTSGLALEGVDYYDGATRIDSIVIDDPHALGLSSDLPAGQFGKVIAEGASLTSFYPSKILVRWADGTITTSLGGDFGSSGGGCTQTYWISEVQDAAGNIVTCSYATVGSSKRLTSIADAYGRVTSFAYDANDMLSSVTDFTGREVQYSYENGQLAEVRSPLVTGTSTGNDFPSGRTTRYEYDATHSQNVVRVIAPEEQGSGTPFLQNTYSADGRRIVAQLRGGTNASGVTAGGRYVFVYDLPAQPIDHGWFVEGSKTLAISPNGNVRLRVFDVAGNDVMTYRYTGRLDPEHATLADPESLTVDALVDVDVSSQAAAMNPVLNGIKAVAAYEAPLRFGYDPRSFMTRKSFNDHALVTQVETLSSHVLFTYDELSPDRFQQGNMLRSEQLPVPDDGSAPIEHTYAYEPFLNQVRAAVDPRGNDATYSPPNGGTTSVGRYLTETVFDFQEGDVLSTLSGLTATWDIDVQQNSQFSELPQIDAEIDRIAAADERGDVNADAVTTQAAGRPIQVVQPSVQIPTRGSLASGTLSFEPQAIVSTKAYNGFGLVTQAVDATGSVQNYLYYEDTDPTGQGAGTTSAANGGQLAQVNAPGGVSTSYAYDVVGRKTGETDGRGHTVQFEFNALDELIVTTDAAGDSVERDYDANGRRIAVRIDNKRPAIDSATGKPTGGTVDLGQIAHAYAYDILGHQIEADLQADFEGQPKRLITRYRYDKDGNRVVTLTPRFVEGDNGHAVRSTTYDERGLLYASSRGGLNFGFLYAALQDVMADPQVAGLPLDPTSGDFSTRLLVYDPSGNVTSEYDGKGEEWVTERDSFGRVRRENQPAVGGASQGHYTEYSWDPSGNLAEVRSYESDAGGGVLLAHTTTKYDEAGRAYETNRAIDTLGHSFVSISDGPLTPGDGWVTERQLFDPLGRLVVSVDDNRHYEATSRDGRGRATRSWDGAGDDLGGASWTQAASVESLQAYDKADNLIQDTTIEYRGDGTSETFRTWAFYDVRNRSTATVDSLGHTSRRAYDSRGNVVFESDARSSLVSTTYLSALDGFSEHPAPPGMAINEHGNTVESAFDDLSRRRRIKRAMRVGGSGEGSLDTNQAGDGWITTETDFDGNGNVTARRDDNGSETQSVYDGLDRLTQRGVVGGGADTLEYDRNDRVTQRVDARGNDVVMTYDASGRRTDVTVTRATNVLGTTWEHYDYDGLGRVVLASDNDSTVTIDYDSLSNTVREIQNGEAVLSPHNGLGQVVSVTYPGGRSIGRTYDDVNRLYEIEELNHSLTIARHHYVGPVRWERRELLPSGATALAESARSYDADRRVVQTLHDRVSDGAIIDHRIYQWDRSDNKTLRTDVVSGVSHTYGYDSQSRLVQSVRAGSPADRTADYELDGVGNRVQVTGGAYAGTYTLGTTGYERNLYTFSPTRRYFYDAEGSVETHHLFSLNPPSSGFPNDVKYDYRNRMVRYDSAHGAVSIYRYDVFGRRIEVRENGVPTFFYYHGEHAVEERGPRGGTLATYVYADHTDDVIAMERGTSNYFYHVDDMGNVMRMSGAAGAAVPTEDYEYDDFGEVLDAATFVAQSNPSRIGNPLFFSGRRLDPETEYYYFRNRYQDPSLGRFTSKDPIGMWGDATNLGNAVSYAGVNPWSARDSHGLLTTRAGLALLATAINEPAVPSPAFPYFLEQWHYSGVWNLLGDQTGLARRDFVRVDAQGTRMGTLGESTGSSQLMAPGVITTFTHGLGIAFGLRRGYDEFMKKGAMSASASKTNPLFKQKVSLEGTTFGVFGPQESQSPECFNGCDFSGAGARVTGVSNAGERLGGVPVRLDSGSTYWFSGEAEGRSKEKVMTKVHAGIPDTRESNAGHMKVIDDTSSGDDAETMFVETFRYLN